jgi:site-specific DNA-methyltransferase (adenine-specific)
VGSFETRKEAENCLAYIQTKLFRLLVGMRKMTQHATQAVYAYVPLLDFNEEWTDEKLYMKYDLTSEEIEFIDSVIEDLGDENGDN